MRNRRLLTLNEAAIKVDARTFRDKIIKSLEPDHRTVIFATKEAQKTSNTFWPICAFCALCG
jgi:hypothetical protein